MKNYHTIKTNENMNTSVYKAKKEICGDFINLHKLALQIKCRVLNVL